ncbi:hypothetical protein ACLOJK_025553 [Asimina triloba]
MTDHGSSIMKSLQTGHPAADGFSNENAKIPLHARAESMPAIPASFRKSLSACSMLEKSPPMSSIVKRSPSSVVQSSPPPAQNSSSSASHTEPVVQPQPARLQIFTANHLKSCISVSENIRLFSSIIIAFWVVLSNHSYLPGSDNFKSTPLKPMYLVLLSDAAIVFGLLLTGRGCHQNNEAGAKRPVKNADDWVEKVSGALDYWLVVQKVMSAAVMDCCIYAAILISGLSLLQ